MKIRSDIVTGFLALTLAGSAQAHRASGLMQATLVEILPTQVGVEVTLVPGMDVAPRMRGLLDANGDGVISESETTRWAEQFLARQSVTVDGHSLPLKLAGVRTSAPDAEPGGGHTDIVVTFTADLGTYSDGARSIVCSNHYEPFPCVYQCNGLMPRSPNVRVIRHQRGEGEKELTLSAEFLAPAKADEAMTPGVREPSAERAPESLAWLAGLSIAVTAGAALIERRRRRCWSSLVKT